jgi:hypothetical protein
MAIPFLRSRPRAAARPDDPLALFDTESPTQDGPVATSPDTSAQDTDADLSLDSFAASQSVALETVIDRRVFVSWLEAVAILEGTCGALVPEEGSEQGAPDPSGIFLTAEGTIEVGRGHRGDSVQRLARTLHVLTSGQAIPAPLRLFISKWIATDGKRLIAEFARELAYFARPNGADLIREVYQRCISAPAAIPLESAHRKQAAAEVEKAQPKPKAAKRRQTALVAAGVAFVAAVAAAVGIAAYFAPQQQDGSSDIVSNLLAGAAEFARSLGEVKTQIGELSSQLTAHLASGDDKSAAEPPSTTANTPNRARAAARSQAARPTAPLVPAPASSFLGAPDIAVPTLAPSAVPSEPADATATARAPEEAAPAAAPIIDPTIIYTSADQEVSPPKMLFPQLPPPPLVIGAGNALNVMEITVGNSGSVEHVRLVSPPRRLTDMMLLSGAKLWKFTPASKDGQPVRYRIAVSWAASIP